MHHDLGTEAGLLDRCQLFRAALGEHGATVTDEELRAHWPGGSMNQNDGFAAWIYCYGSYRSFLDRAERASSAGPSELDQSEHAAQAVARGTPEVVDLDTLDEAGVPIRRLVYPQSFHTICCIEEWDALLGRLAATYRDLQSASSDLLALHGGAILQRISHYERLICWVLTHEASPGRPLPFVESGDEPTPPQWTKCLSPLDVIRFLNAHRLVNGGRLSQALQVMGANGGNGRRLSWVSLLGSAAKEMGTNLRAVSRDYTLETAVYQLALSRAAEPQESGTVEPED